MRINNTKRAAIIECSQRGMKLETIATLTGMSQATIAGVLNANENQKTINSILSEIERVVKNS